MEYSKPEPDSLKKIIHDLNGELFLIRGYVDLTKNLVENDEIATRNLQKIMERTHALEDIIQILRDKQQEIEPEA